MASSRRRSIDRGSGVFERCRRRHSRSRSNPVKLTPNYDRRRQVVLRRVKQLLASLGIQPGDIGIACAEHDQQHEQQHEHQGCVPDPLRKGVDGPHLSVGQDPGQRLDLVGIQHPA